MDDTTWLAERFEENRPRMHAVAYRMLGSLSEADDAVQEAWIRLSRSDAEAIENLTAWLTTVVGRVCLNMLRSRRTRREDELDLHVPDPIITAEHGDPEENALLADAVGLALQVVLETLNPTERVAFVLHDMFAVPFDEIATMVGRTPVATRQMASRARRRIEEAQVTPDSDLSEQRRVVDAFLAAAREGDLEGLIAVLDPNVVLRADGGSTRPGALVHGAEAVASRAASFGRFAHATVHVLVNGAAGIISVAEDGTPFSVGSVTVRHGKIVAMVLLADAERLAELHVDALSPGDSLN